MGNFMFVFMPKFTLWWFTAIAGEDFQVNPEGEELNEEQQVEKHFKSEHPEVGLVLFDLCKKRLAKLALAIVATYFFVWHYYDTHCELRDGRYVSKPVHLPKSTDYTALNVLLPYFFPVEKDEEPFWT